jgi:dTDP-4-amino-4,6-dideoxygalactose transaminase
MEEVEDIQSRRVEIWKKYYNDLKGLEERAYIQLPVLPDYATVNGSMFFLITKSFAEREKLIEHLKKHNIYAVFHYLPLHDSPYYRDKHDGRPMPNAERYADCILRLPFYYELRDKDIDRVVGCIKEFYLDA